MSKYINNSDSQSAFCLRSGKRKEAIMMTKNIILKEDMRALHKQRRFLHRNRPHGSCPPEGISR